MSRISYFLLSTSILIIASCGGGGGGGSSPPTSNAINDSSSTDEDSAVSIDVTANDINMDLATVEVTTSAANGTTTVNAVGIVTYTPDLDFNGADTFTYRVTSNNNSGSGSAVVTVTIHDVNDVPVAAVEFTTTMMDTPVVIDILANDGDVDGFLDPATVRIAADATNGSISIDAIDGGVTFTPSAGFTGTDDFTYTVLDDDGAESNEANVSITVFPIGTTVLAVIDLVVPIDNNDSEINEELDSTIPVSQVQRIVLPPNSVSFALHLLGAAVATDLEALFVSELTDPAGQTFFPVFERVEFCDAGYCSILVPKQPSAVATAGEWQFRLASGSNSTSVVHVPQLKLAVRVGPQPDVTASAVAEVVIKPFLTGTSVIQSDLEPILDKVVELLQLNGVTASIDPVTILTDPKYAEVSKDFNNEDTADLVSNGDPLKVNLFYLESFIELGLLGITGGIPATLGVQSRFNAVLINATGTIDLSSAAYTRTTAETTVHEIGHYLGLTHTTEARFNDTDNLDDTPECIRNQHDTNSDGIADSSECPDGGNMMFWESVLEIEKMQFTEDQKHVLHFSPLAITAGEL